MTDQRMPNPASHRWAARDRGPMKTERQLSAVLIEFARTMVTDFPIQSILDHLVRRIVEILPVTGAGVTLISASASPRYVAASDSAALRFEQLQTELAEGPCIAAYRSGALVEAADLRVAPHFPAFASRALDAGLAAAFAFPLRQGDRQLGALDLYRDTPGALSGRDLVVAQTLADVAAAYLVNAQSRADLQASSDSSRESAIHDALTGVANRLLLVERMEHAIARGQRSDKTMAVLFADLDRFKAVNDAHGHQVGDELLVAVARRLSSLLRPGDTVARMSGDEFVVLCEDLEDDGEAEVIAARIVEALTLPFTLSGIEVEISVSVGIAVATSGRVDWTPEGLLQDADVAMYQAKRRGGRRHQVIDRRELQLANRRTSLQRELRGAVRSGQLRLDYQPIVQTDGGRIVAAEALLRWDHPTRGLIPPTLSVPLAETSGVIVDIGSWVLERSCVDRRRWTEATGRELGISVNVSAYQLMAPGFVAMVDATLMTTGTRPDSLTLEITESLFLHDSERALVVLGQLKRMGVLLALDDFGTGYSSLSYLKQFPVDVVKIDRCFVTNLGQDWANLAIVGKVIELAHVLGLTIVVEGVETLEEHVEVTALGGELSQGYYFARPMSSEKMVQWILSSRGARIIDDRRVGH